MEEIERCENCGASMKAFWQRLTPGLVNMLIKAIIFVHKKGENRFHYVQDLSLSHTEAANFQKLRFHGLIAHADENQRSGRWLITKRGGQFLRGEINVPIQVKTFRDRVIDHDIKLIGIKSFRGKVSDFDQEFAYEYVRPVDVATIKKQEALF